MFVVLGSERVLPSVHLPYRCLAALSGPVLQNRCVQLFFATGRRLSPRQPSSPSSSSTASTSTLTCSSGALLFFSCRDHFKCEEYMCGIIALERFRKRIGDAFGRISSSSPVWKSRELLWFSNCGSLLFAGGVYFGRVWEFSVACLCWKACSAVTSCVCVTSWVFIAATFWVFFFWKHLACTVRRSRWTPEHQAYPHTAAARRHQFNRFWWKPASGFTLGFCFTWAEEAPQGKACTELHAGLCIPGTAVYYLHQTLCWLCDYLHKTQCKD